MSVHLCENWVMVNISVEQELLEVNILGDKIKALPVHLSISFLPQVILFEQQHSLFTRTGTLIGGPSRALASPSAI